MQIYKLTCLLLTLSVSILLPAQIRFIENAAWSDALTRAKNENKLVFVDVYTEWCGPCKKMDTEVFNLPEIGKVYNSDFINIKLDAEKGEGIAIAKKYQVTTYPNYLFINGDGVLVYRAGGSMPAKDFLHEAKAAAKEASQTYTVLQMQNDYPLRKSDKEFMYAYVSRLTALRLSVGSLLDEYITMLNPEEQSAQKNIQLTVDNATWLNRKLSFGAAYDNLVRNKAVFEELKTQKLVKGETMESISSNVKDASLRQAIRTKNEELLQKVLAITGSAKQDPFNNQQTVAMEYYHGVGDKKKYLALATRYVQGTLLSIPADSLEKWDWDIYKAQKAHFEKQENLEYNNPAYIYTYRHTQTIQLTNALCNICETLCEEALPASMFQTIKEWSAKMIATAQSDIAYYKNVIPRYRKVNALVLYRCGEKKAARTEVRQLLSTATAVSEHTLLEEMLAKMQEHK